MLKWACCDEVIMKHEGALTIFVRPGRRWLRGATPTTSRVSLRRGLTPCEGGARNRPWQSGLGGNNGKGDGLKKYVTF